jgi:SAM-dependent methyltransferase
MRSKIKYSLIILSGLASLFLKNPVIASENLEEIFTKVYEKKIWGQSSDGFGSSGSGSVPEASKEYVAFVNDFIKKNNVKSVLDIGCGDGVITGLLDLSEDIHYIGIDLVEGLLEKNRIKFPRYSFIKMNAINDQLPQVDLVLCKDVLQHLGNHHILNILENVKEIAEYALFTNDSLDEKSQLTKSINTDIESGPFHRFIDLRASPFNRKGFVIKSYKCPSGEYKMIFLESRNDKF